MSRAANREFGHSVDVGSDDDSESGSSEDEVVLSLPKSSKSLKINPSYKVFESQKEKALKH